MKKRLILCLVLIAVLFQTVIMTQAQSFERSSELPPEGKFSSVEELKKKRIGVLTGSSFDAVAKEQLPDAQTK